MFYAKVTWYNDYTDQSCTEHMLIPAKDYVDAVTAINLALPNIDNIDIKDMILSVDNVRIVYIPEDCVDKVLDMNNY